MSKFNLLFWRALIRVCVALLCSGPETVAKSSRMMLNIFIPDWMDKP
jgi:hypothetical protein